MTKSTTQGKSLADRLNELFDNIGWRLPTDDKMELVSIINGIRRLEDSTNALSADVEALVISHLFENTIEGFTSQCDCLRFKQRDDIAHGLISLSELDYPPVDQEGILTIVAFESKEARFKFEESTSSAEIEKAVKEALDSEWEKLNERRLHPDGNNPSDAMFNQQLGISKAQAVVLQMLRKQRTGSR